MIEARENAYRKVTVKGKDDKFCCYFDILNNNAGIWTSSVVVRRNVFDKIGSFREGYRLGEDIDMWFRIGLYYNFACSPKICALYYYNQSDSACSIAVPNRISPLYLSLLKLKKDTAINPDIKSKAIKYLSLELAKDIRYVFLKGYRRIARHRLHLYKRYFGANSQYIRLCIMNIIPPVIMSGAALIRLKAVRYLQKHMYISTRI